MTPDPEDTDTWVGRSALDREGRPVGVVGAVYADEATGAPAWLAVEVPSRAGLTQLRLAPVAGSLPALGELRLGYDRALIGSAPVVGEGEIVSGEEVGRALDHYGLDFSPSRGDRAGDAEAAVVTRSEEEASVSTRTVVAGRVRLHKYVVAEEVTLTVVLHREELRVEQVPAEELEEGVPLPEAPALLGEAGQEELLVDVVLFAEEPVVAKRVVAKERVVLVRSVVSERVTVTEQLRKEQVEMYGDAPSDSG